MIIDWTEDGDLNYDTENFDKLSKGIVIFPENLKEAERLNTLKSYIEKEYSKIMWG